MNPDLVAQLRAWNDRHASQNVEPDFPVDTASGLAVAPVYTPLDLGLGEDPATAEHYARQLGLPGEAPFTRGVSHGTYRERLWVMGMYSGKASPDETNRRIKELLSQGQRGFSIALDLPTQNGYDSDHPLAQGEVGRVGVPIDSLQDMEQLLDGIPLDRVEQIRTTANAIGPLAVALFVAAAESHGYKATDFKVLMQNDVLKEYVARGTYIFPPARALELTVDVIEYCATHLPAWEPIEFCGYHVRDSGANAVQELAIAMANGEEYLDACLRRELSIDQVAPTIFMFLSVGLDLFEEVAKFRAARRMWCRLMEERFDAQDPRSKALNLFVYTLGGSLVAQEPRNNVVRVAYEALAAALGGAQTMATSSFDEALGLPSDEAALTALRTQQILAYETGVVRAADPLGGSYLVEALTDEIEVAVTRYRQRIAEHGGALAAIESGWMRAEIEEQAWLQQVAVDTGTKPVVGVNRFHGAQRARISAASENDRTAEQEQVAKLRELRATRDSRQVGITLDAVRQAARCGANTVPSILEATRAYATIGEICSALTDIWGRHRSSPALL